MNEFELLDELERRGLIVGVEHDAAEIGGLVVTQDTLVEGVHFRFDLLDWRALGFRAAAVNISDLSASGAALPNDARLRRESRTCHSPRSSFAQARLHSSYFGMGLEGIGPPTPSLGRRRSIH